MFVQKLEVEEGFLDGVAVEFVPGLNVVIGTRGAGKTSLIELLRFCLGVESYSGVPNRDALEHAYAVLGSGVVTATLLEDGRPIKVSRSADDPEPRADSSFRAPIIFSQREIESVGLDAAGRLRLIDHFVHQRRKFWVAESAAASEVRSLTNEIDNLRKEITELAEQLGELPTIDESINLLAPEERNLATLSTDAAKKKVESDSLAKSGEDFSVGAAYLQRFLSSMTQWLNAIGNAVDHAPTIETWPKDLKEPDPLRDIRPKLSAIEASLSQAATDLQSIIDGTHRAVAQITVAKSSVEDRLRTLRMEIEKIQEGAGAIVRRAQTLREKRAQLRSLSEVSGEKQKRLAGQVKRRDAALDRLESARDGTYQARRSVADRLSESLGPRIRIVVEHASQTDSYVAAVADVLRGSGLKYNDLSNAIASHISPRELLEIVEGNDATRISALAGIGLDRAARVSAQLATSNLGDLATILVEDDIRMQMLDASDYKNIGELSVGQRCTVILPIVLEHRDNVVVIDQPEDHIDNAFIAETLIKSLLNRPEEHQIILSTHNANIPVLGDAKRVIHLGSDGRRGYVQKQSSLDDPDIVDAITSLMEGGADAFQKRARFYTAHKR